jgi:hypothetical protein
MSVVAASLSIVLIQHPFGARAGDQITAMVARRPSKQYLMWTFAGLTAASVLYVLIGGGSAQ